MGLSYFVMKWLLRFSAEVSYNAHPVFLTLLQNMYGGVSKSSQTGRLNRELQMVELSATRYSRIVISWVSLVSFAAITLCVASQRVLIFLIVYFVIDSVRKIVYTPSYIQTTFKFLPTFQRRYLISWISLPSFLLSFLPSFFVSYYVLLFLVSITFLCFISFSFLTFFCFSPCSFLCFLLPFCFPVFVSLPELPSTAETVIFAC
jgi:hypothetical protein